LNVNDDNQQSEKILWSDLRLVILLLGGLTLWLICFQYYTLVKFNVLAPGLRYESLAIFLKAVRLYVPLNWIDGLLAVLIIGTAIALVLLEILRSHLTKFFSLVFESEKRTLWLLAAACLLLVRFYFARGDTSWAADTNNHLPYAWIAARAFALGEIPIWTNYFSSGSPFLQFYGFLFFYLVGAANLLFSDFFFSIKFVLAASHVASGIGMYLLTRSLTDSRQAGFVAGIAYVVRFWHTQQVLMMGRLPLSVFYGLLPYPFYCFERLRQNRESLTTATFGAVTLACLAFTHPGYAFWATAFLLLHIVVRMTLQSQDFPGHMRRYAQGLFFGGLVLASYHLLPMYLERGYVTLAKGLSFPGFPDPTWRHLILWSNYRVRLFGGLPHFYGGYLGFSLILLSIIGGVAAVRHRPNRRYIGNAPLLCLLGAGLLVFGHQWPILRSIPIV
jgi:hypothetical protein